MVIAPSCARNVPGLCIATRRRANRGGNDALDGIGGRGVDLRVKQVLGRRLRRGGIVECVEAVRHVDAEPAGRQLLAEADPPDRVGDQRRAQGDLGDQLWPGGQGGADLDEGCRHPGRQPGAVHHAQRVGDLVLAGQFGQLGQVDIAEQAVQDRPLRLEVEPLDVQQAAVAGGHQDGHTSRARRLADQDLGVQRVAFLDDECRHRREIRRRTPR